MIFRLPSWVGAVPSEKSYTGFFLVISGFYIYQLIRSSRQRGGLIAELEKTTRQLKQEQDKNAELAVLQERERLARDMHDGLGHTMAALSVQLEAIQRLYPVAPEKASEMIDAPKRLSARAWIRCGGRCPVYVRQG